MEFSAQCGEPAAAPDPVAEDGVDEHGNEQAEDEEGLEGPSFRHAAGGDGSRRIHEHHLEEEERKNAYVIDLAVEEKAYCTQQLEIVSEHMNGPFVGDDAGGASQCRCIQTTAEHKGKTTDPKSEHSKSIDQKVHSHG